MPASLGVGVERGRPKAVSGVVCVVWWWALPSGLSGEWWKRGVKWRDVICVVLEFGHGNEND